MANRYWNPSGAANWADANVWALTDGGTADQATPTASDDVFFTSTNVNNCTIGASATCLSIDFTGGTGYTGTLAGSSALAISGSMTLNSGMGRTYTGAITFNSTATGKTLTFNTKTLASSVTFNGSGGGWTIQDAFDNSGNSIILTTGTLDTNGQTITCDTFNSSNSNTRTLTLGASSISTRTWTLTTISNLTFNANTSTITFTGAGAFSSGGLTYYNVVCNHGANSFTSFSGTNTFNDLTINGTSALQRGAGIAFSGNNTVNGTFTVAGNTIDSRLYIGSSVTGTQRTLTVNAISISNADFQDINAAGASAPWDLSGITGKSGDCTGNSNITFTTGQTNYWVGNGGDWTDSANHWATSSGGTAGTGRVPLPQDTTVFDANSFSSASQTVNANANRWGKDVNFTGVTNSPTIDPSGVECRIFGSLTFISGMTFTSDTLDIIFMGNGSDTLTSGTLSFANHPVTINKGGGTLTLADDFVSTNTSGLTLTVGTFNANNNDVTCYLLSSSNSNTRTITMGSGTWNLTGTGTVWNCGTATNLTINANTSTIKIDDASATGKTFAGGGKTYNNIWFSGAGTGIFTLSGSNTFTDLKVDTPPHTIKFTASTTTTVTTFTVSGTAGNAITIDSTTSTNHTLTKAGGGTISCDYLDIANSTATPGSTWYAGANSVDTGPDNSGWIFTAPPSSEIKTYNGLAYASVKTINGLAIASVKTINGLA